MSRLRGVAVTGDGIKGWTGEVRLTGCDVFTGTNGAGKSTRLLAVIAGLRGMAQSPSDPVKVWLGGPRPDSMVELAFADGVLVRDLSKVSGKDATRADLEAERLAGPHVARWDLADFASASDQVREDTIRRAAASSASTAAGASAMLADYAARPPDPAPADWLDVVKARQTVCAELVKAVPAPSSGLAGAWIEQAFAWLRTSYTAANADARTAAAAATEAMRTDGAARPSGSLADARARLAKAQADLAEVEGELAKAQGTARSVEEFAARGKRLVGAVDQAQQRLEALRARPETTAQPAGPDIAALEQAAQQAILAVDAADKAVADAVSKRDALKVTEQAARDAATSARAAADEKRATAALLRELAQSATGACTHCGGADPLGLEARIAAAEADVASAEAELDERAESLADTSTDYTIATGRVRKAEAAQREAVSARTSATARLDAAKSQAATTAARAEQDAQRARSEVKAAEETLATAESELRLWQAEQAPVLPVGGVGSITARQVLAKELVRTESAAVEEMARGEEREKGRQAAIARRDTTAQRLAAVKAVGDALKLVQADIARQAYGPICDRANELLTLAASPLRARMDGPDSFGATTPRGDIPFAALSDAERAIVGAAFAYALITLSNTPWRALVLDGLEKVDEGNLAGLLHGLGEMVARGQIDNVIGALQTTEPLGEIEGVTFHHLGAMARSEAA